MRTIFFLFSLSLLSATTVWGQEYEIRFNRPAKIGQTCLYEGEMSQEQSQKVDIDGQPKTDKQSKISAKIKGKVEVTAVTKDGSIQGIKIEIVDWQLQSSAGEIPGPKPGDIVEKNAGETKQFSIKGNALTGPVAEALGQFFSLHTETDKDMDDLVMGPGKKVKVGDSWPINSELGAKDLADKIHSSISPEMIKGQTKLDAVEGSTQKLSAHIAVDASGMQMPGAPKGFRAQRFTMEDEVAGDFPVDVEQQSSNQSEEMKMDLEGSTTVDAGGKNVTVKLAMSMHLKKTAKSDWKK